MDKSTKEQLNSLLINLKDGDLNSLDTIYELTYKAVFSIALSVVHNSEDAKDIMMNTYIRIREKIHYYMPNTNAYAWILTMARNISINEHKKLTRTTAVDFSQFEFAGDSNINDNIPVFKIAKRVLNADELTIVLLHIVSGYKHREIASIVNKPLGTVLWSYNNSLKKIKKYIGGSYEK